MQSQQSLAWKLQAVPTFYEVVSKRILNFKHEVDANTYTFSST